VVVGVLGVREQGAGQPDAMPDKQSLERRGQDQPDQARAIVATHRGELREQIGRRFDVRRDPPAEDGVDRHLVGHQADCPGPDRFVLVVEEFAEEGDIRSADHVESPERPELAGGIRIPVEELAERRPRLVE
jgi:hypothetical protein